MVLAALLSIWLRANLPLAVALCWITNPLTMGPIFYLAYRIGATAMGVTPGVVEFELSWEWITHGLLAIWQPFLLGCFICGLFFGSLGYFVISMLWRWRVATHWAQRKRQRQEQKAETQAGPAP